MGASEPPPIPPPVQFLSGAEAQSRRDAQHVDLLRVFHYVVAGLLALFGCMYFVYIGIGVAVLSRAGPFGGKDAPPDSFGWLFAGMGAAGLAFLWGLAALALVSAAMLKRRRRRIFCMVVAAMLCLFHPFGTVLGVFTLLVLARPSVKDAFKAGPSATDR